MSSGCSIVPRSAKYRPSRPTQARKAGQERLRQGSFDDNARAEGLSAGSFARVEFALEPPSATQDLAGWIVDALTETKQITFTLRDRRPPPIDRFAKGRTNVDPTRGTHLRSRKGTGLL